VTRGFAVNCILCGEAGPVRLDLADVASFKCEACDGEFSLDAVEAHLDAWDKVVSWVKTAPPIE